MPEKTIAVSVVLVAAGGSKIPKLDRL